VWPGNVRELQHVIERAVAMSGERQALDADDIEITGVGAGPAPRTFKEAKERVVSAFERAYLEELLTAHAGNIGRAARAASKNRRALWELMRKHAISAAPFRAPPLVAVRQGFRRI
jgi:two-component system response regulator GlrR